MKDSKKFQRMARFMLILTLAVSVLPTGAVFAQDEATPEATEPVEENQPLEETAAAEISATPTLDQTKEVQDLEVEVTLVPTGEAAAEEGVEAALAEEAEPTPEEVQEIVESLAEKDAVLADDSGQPIAMGSEEAVEALKAQDPWFEANDASGDVIGYTTLAGTCAPGVTICHQVANPVQAAVDDPLSTGQTIIIDGIYNEQVSIIGKNVTLQAGAGGGGLAADGEIVENAPDLYGLLYVENAHVNILGLSFNGSGGYIDGSGFDNYYSGIVFNNSTGVIQGVTINDFEDDDVFDEGVGIYIKDSDGVLVDDSSVETTEQGIIIDNSTDTHVTNSEVSDYYEYGIDIIGEGSDVSIIHNTIDGIAGEGKPQQSGIHVDGATASLQCNTISNSRDNGIFVENTDYVEILYNTFTADNEKAIYTRYAGTDETPLQVHFNNIYKAPGASWTIWGYRSYIDASDNYWEGAAPTGVVESLSTIVTTPFSLTPFSSDDCPLCDVFSFCGDGIVTGAEECDDGNTEDGDGCSAQCTIEVLPPVADLNLTSMCWENDTTHQFRVTNPNDFAVDFTWQVYGTSQTGGGTAEPGYTYFTVTGTKGSATTTKLFWYDHTGAQKQKTKAANQDYCSEPVENLKLTSMCWEDDTTHRFRVRNPNDFAVDFTWQVYGTSQTGGGTAQPGDNFFTVTGIKGNATTTKLFWYDHTGARKETVKAANQEYCVIPVENLKLTSMCWENETTHKFRVRNPNDFDVDYTVHLSGSGSYTAPPGDSYFYVTSVHGTSTTTIIKWFDHEGVQRQTTKAANQNFCEAFCGDGIVQVTEECDDGNEINDDACSNECTIDWTVDVELDPYCVQGDQGYLMQWVINNPNNFNVTVNWSITDGQSGQATLSPGVNFITNTELGTWTMTATWAGGGSGQLTYTITSCTDGGGGDGDDPPAFAGGGLLIPVTGEDLSALASLPFGGTLALGVAMLVKGLYNKLGKRRK